MFDRIPMMMIGLCGWARYEPFQLTTGFYASNLVGSANSAANSAAELQPPTDKRLSGRGVPNPRCLRSTIEELSRTVLQVKVCRDSQARNKSPTQMLALTSKLRKRCTCCEVKCPANDRPHRLSGTLLKAGKRTSFVSFTKSGTRPALYSTGVDPLHHTAYTLLLFCVRITYFECARDCHGF